MKRKVEAMETLSHEKKELILDVPFTAEEVGGATKRNKKVSEPND